MSVVAEPEVAEDVAVLIAQMVKASADEALYWESRLRHAALKERVHGVGWAPRDKGQWRDTVKVVDEDGITAGFIDVTDAVELEPVAEAERVLVERAGDVVVADDGVGTDGTDVSVREFEAVAPEVVAQRWESRQERLERIGEDEVAWELEQVLDDEFASLMDNPRFARLVEQENLVMDSEGLWVIPEGSEVFGADLAGEHLSRLEVLEVAEKAGWVYDGVPGVRPERPVSEPVEFEPGQDHLERVGGQFWVKRTEAEGARELDSGVILTESQAREIAEDKLGWQWVDSAGEQVDSAVPVVVADGAGVDLGEFVGRAVVADRWGWADAAAEDAQVVRADQSGSPVPFGTGEPVQQGQGWDATWYEEMNQQFFHQQEETTTHDMHWN